jgi:hypothetical protein
MRKAHKTVHCFAENANLHRINSNLQLVDNACFHENFCNTLIIHSYSCCFLWSIGHPWKALFHFSFLISTQSVELLGRSISPSPGHYQHRTIQTQSNRRRTSMLRVGYKATIPKFERANIVYALDRPATLMDSLIQSDFKLLSEFLWSINGNLDSNLESLVYQSNE